jgi:hypothetical protein
MPDFAKAVLGRLFPELISYLPLIPLLQRVTVAEEPKERAIAIVDLLRFGANRTSTSLDGELLDHVEACLRTPEGGALAKWISTNLTDGIFQMEAQHDA